MTSPTQADQILLHLQSGQTITPIEALDLFRCFRLSARIHDLIQAGHNIVNEWETDGTKKWAKYRWLPPVRVTPVQMQMFDEHAT